MSVINKNTPRPVTPRDMWLMVIADLVALAGLVMACTVILISSPQPDNLAPASLFLALVGGTAGTVISIDNMIRLMRARNYGWMLALSLFSLLLALSCGLFVLFTAGPAV